MDRVQILDTMPLLMGVAGSCLPVPRLFTVVARAFRRIKAGANSCLPHPLVSSLPSLMLCVETRSAWTMSSLLCSYSECLVKCRSPYSDLFPSGMPMSFDYLIFCQSSRMSGTLAAARNLLAFCCIRVLSVLCISIQLVCTWCYGGRSD